MRDSDLDEQTRRTVIKAVGGALATGAAGSAAAHHPREEGNGAPNRGHDHTKAGNHETVGEIEQVGYHSLGGRGQDDAENPHYGVVTELRVQDGLAFVGFLSSRGPTPNRGFAILDVSDFTTARNEADLETADMTFLAAARDDNDASAVMDVKVTDDANYAIVSREPFAAAFDRPNTNRRTDYEGTSAGANSLQVYDVSDPTDPRLVSEWSAFAEGPHNAYTHMINGTDYVFAVGYAANLAGLHVFEFDRSTETLELVNKWDKGGNATSGNAFVNYGDAHDVTVVDDPKTDRPYVYFGMWSSPGMQVLDASDPTDLKTVGKFPMNRSHYVQPAPTLVNGKRVAIAGQETLSVDEGSSGRLYLVDCDGLDESGETNPVIGRGEMKATKDEPAEFLDMWEWADPISFGSDALYYLGPHNADITEQGWVHLAHYHGGTMFFEITDDFELAERGSFKPTEPVPEESMTELPVLGGLGKFQPFAWCAVEDNGLTFVSDINQGVFVAEHHDLAVGSNPVVDIDAGLNDSSSVYTAGQTAQMDLEVDVEVTGADAVWVRARVPSEWSVAEAGDDFRKRDLGHRTVVEFRAPVGAGRGDGGTTTDGTGTRTFFAEAPASSGSYDFGPVEYTTDPPSMDEGDRLWHKLPGAVDTNLVTGLGTELF